MIKPVNNHILIEPVKHESFMASQKETYEEIGIIIDISDGLKEKVRFSKLNSFNTHDIIFVPAKIKKGDKVYFDSWLAAKFPKNDIEWYWLVKWEDVRAVEYAE